MNNIKKVLSVLLLLLLVQTAYSSEDNNRSKKTLGVYGSVLGGPFYMGNIGINFLSGLIRFNGGYGQKSISVAVLDETAKAKVTVTGVGLRILVPGWNLSPFIGADYLIGKASVTIVGQTVSATVTGISAAFGIDYTSSLGLNLGALVYSGS